MFENFKKSGPALESPASESAPEAGDHAEQRIQEERTLLHTFRKGKTWKAARALLLVSFLGAGGSHYATDRGDDMDEDSQSTTTEQSIPEKPKYLTEARYRRILENSVGGVLQDADLFKKEPWAESLTKEAVDVALQNAPDYVLRYAVNLKNYPWGMAKIRAAVENKMTYEAYILEYASAYKDEPWAEAKIKRAVEQSIKRNSLAALQHSSSYIDRPWGSEFLKQAVKGRLGDPVTLLDLAKNYKAQPWGPDMLKTVANEVMKKSPLALLRFADRYKSEPWGEEFLGAAVERTIEVSPQAAVDFAGVYKDTPGWGKEKLQRAVEKVFNKKPADLIPSAKKYRQEPWGEAKLKESVEWAIEHDIKTALQYLSEYRDEVWSKDAIRKTIEKALVSDSKLVLQYGYLAQDDPWVANKCKEAFAQVAKGGNLAEIFYTIGNYWQQPWAKKEVEQAAKKAAVTNPDLAIAHIRLYRNEAYAGEVVTTALKRDPLQVFRYEVDKEILFRLGATDPFLQVIANIRGTGHKEDVQRDMMLLIDEIVKGEITIEESAEIAQNPGRFLGEILKIKARPDPLGAIALDRRLKNFSLRSIREINDLHERPDVERFKSIEKAGSEALYTLMVYGEEEIFTSTFGGLFTRLLKTMKEEGVNGGQLLEKTKNLRFRSFVKMAAGFNRLNEFLQTMDSRDRTALLQKFVENIEKEKDPLSQAVAVADVFSTIQDGAVLKVFQEVIKQEYERVKIGQDKNAEVIYGLLAGMFSKKAIINEEWTREIAKQYKLPDIMEIPSQDLFNRDGSNVQRYFFYNDEDGHASFSNFLAQYKDKGDWTIETQENYVLIVSKKGNKKIEIYANKPSKEDEGQEAIEKALAKRKVESIMIVHRGHSYHAGKTIRNIPSIAKIVSLGSCGGYNNIDAVLKMAPEAHVISTKGVGTMTVNDPLFRMINEKISRGENLNWPALWKEAERKLSGNKDFDNYVPPHKNLGVLFLKAYTQLKKD